MVRQVFQQLSDADAFALCFPGILKQTEDVNEFDLVDQPYRLKFVVQLGYGQDCPYCERKQCRGCQVPFDSTITVQSLLDKFGISGNNSMFVEDRKIRGREVKIELIWHQEIHETLYRFLGSAVPLSAQKGWNES
jgi:hypothetical protein